MKKKLRKLTSYERMTILAVMLGLIGLILDNKILLAFFMGWIIAYIFPMRGE